MHYGIGLGCNGRHVDTHWMTEWWPRIKGRKRWGGCDEVVLGDERARRGARSCWRGPSEYNGRSTECNVLMDGIFAGLGEHRVG